MTTVRVGYGLDSTHDISLSDGSTTYGLIFDRGGARVLQEIPLSPPAQTFQIEQKNWIGGKGRRRYVDDPTGFFDAQTLWSTSEGKIHPSLQTQWAKGIRNNDSYMPVYTSTVPQVYVWKSLYSTTRYHSISFSASASYTTAHAWFRIRRRGSPGTLTVELCSDTAGNPGSVLQTATVTTTTITDTLAILHKFAIAQAITSGTTYHLKIYGAGSDNSTNYWQVLADDYSTGSKQSSDNSAWSDSSCKMYYRLTDAEINRMWYFFDFEGAKMAVSRNLDASASKLFINGLRGIATAGTSNTLTCSALSMTTDRFKEAYIRIIDGTGDGQTPRWITANTSTQFTVTPNWDVTPDATSKFLVYNTDWWTEITGHGLGQVTGYPAISSGIAYFPQGLSVNMRRMRLNGNTWEFAADGTNKASLLYACVEGGTSKIFRTNSNDATLKSATTVAWGTDLTFGDSKQIGESNYRINNLYLHNKVLHIFKEDGPYTFSNNYVEQLGGNFKDAPDWTTGLAVTSKDNFLWFGWSHSLERMAGASVNDMMAYKFGFEGMAAGERGYVSSAVSAVGWLFFSLCTDGLISNTSTILAWNGYGFHELYKTNANNVKIRSMSWQGMINARPRLWFEEEGDIKFIQFPIFTATPTRDSGVTYCDEGVLVTGTLDRDDPQLYKILGLLRLYLDSGSVEIDYQTNANVGGSTWTVLGTASTTPVSDMTLNLGGVFQIRFRLRLQSAATYSPAILSGTQLTGRIMPLKKYQWVGTFKADTNADTYGDEPDDNPSTIYSQLQTWAQNQTKLTMRSQMQSADSKTVTVSLPTKSADWVDGTDWGGRFSVAILET